MTAVYRKELKSYFCNMVGYVVIAFTLLIIGIYASNVNFGSGYPNFEYSFGSATYIFLFIIPILTMRSISEERKNKTDQLLYALPCSTTEIVMGKYLSMITIFAIPCIIMCVFPPILSIYGKVEMLRSYVAILGFFLLGTSLISLGMFLSSLSDSQIVSAVLSFGSSLILYLISAISEMIPSTSVSTFIAFTALALLILILIWNITKNITVSVAVGVILEIPTVIIFLVNKQLFEGLINKILILLSPFDRLNGFINGMLDLTSVLFYLSFAFIFVFLTCQSVEKRRWS